MTSINWYIYEPTLLEKDEFNFDLAVRKIIGLPTRRAEAIELRTQLQNEASGKEDNPLYFNSQDPTSEIQDALIALETISDALSKISLSTKTVICEYAKSRISHWLNRLNSIEQKSSSVEEIITKLELQLDFVESGDVLANHRKSDSDEEGAVGGNIEENPTRQLLTQTSSSVRLGRSSLPLLAKGRGRGLLSRLKDNPPLWNQNNVAKDSNVGTIPKSRVTNQSNNTSGVSDVDELFSRMNVNQVRPRIHLWNAVFVECNI